MADRTPDCDACHLRYHCPIQPLTARPDRPVGTNPQMFQLRPGDKLYRCGEPATHVHMLRSGLTKGYGITAAGTEHIRAFYFPGELMSVEAFSRAQYTGYLMALDTAQICTAPVSELISAQPPVQQRLLQHISHSASVAEQLTLLLSKLSATQRVAAFLLEFCNRLREPGQPSHELQLKISRKDMANYLGITVETASRTLSQLKADGYVAANHSTVRILEPNGLRELAAPTPHAKAGQDSGLPGTTPSPPWATGL